MNRTDGSLSLVHLPNGLKSVAKTVVEAMPLQANAIQPFLIYELRPVSKTVAEVTPLG